MKTWLTSFLNLAHSDPVIKVFQQKGQNVIYFGDATSTIPVERFLCSVYSPSAAAKRIQELRWELFHCRNLFGKKLSPTIGTLRERCQRQYQVPELAADRVLWRGLIHGATHHSGEYY